jgi:hypothetical protein
MTPKEQLIAQRKFIKKLKEDLTAYRALADEHWFIGLPGCGIDLKKTDELLNECKKFI